MSNNLLLSLLVMLPISCSQSTVDLRTVHTNQSGGTGVGSDGTKDSTRTPDLTPESTLDIDVFKVGLVDGSPIKWDGKLYAKPRTDLIDTMKELEEKAAMATTGTCIDGVPSDAASVFNTVTSSKELIYFSDGDIILGNIFYMDSRTCEGEGDIWLGSVYAISNPIKTAPNNYKINIRYNAHTALPTTNKGANRLSSINYCGIPNWRQGTPARSASESNAGGCSAEDSGNSIGATGSEMDFMISSNSVAFLGTTFNQDYTKLISQLLGTTNSMALTSGNSNPFHIVGGSVVTNPKDSVAKATVSLKDKNGNSFCTGTLIGPNYVVTAAHCLYDTFNKGANAPSNVFVHFADESKKVSVVSAKIHENYKNDFLNTITPNVEKPSLSNEEIYDIAVLKLGENAPTEYNPIAILPLELTPKKGDQIILAGWGSTEDFTESPVLRSAESNKNESSSTSKTFSISSKKGVGMCSGDSGGPAYYVYKDHLFLIGATSYGDSRYSCLTGDGVYVDVRRYTDWIGSAIN